MEIYQSEQEQVEALKKWWRENATAVIGGVVTGVGTGFAVLGLRAYPNARAEPACVGARDSAGRAETDYGVWRNWFLGGGRRSRPALAAPRLTSSTSCPYSTAACSAWVL